MTDNPYGYAYANLTLGSTPGTYRVTGAGGGQSFTFAGTASAQPTISAGGVVNAANSNTSSFTSPVAPGSFASIYGSALSYNTGQNYSTVRLPLSMNEVTVTFDAPASGSLPAISVPGYPVYVSAGQVNLQIPWELQGYPSAQAKVTLDYRHGNVVTVPISNYAPAFFEVTPGTVAALDTNNKVISASNAAVRGQAVQFFASGLGPVTNQPASGNVALVNPRRIRQARLRF